MIAKITHGRSAVRALAYDHGPGRADEHHHPRKVAGNVPGRDWQQRAQRMQRFVSAHQHDRGDRGGIGWRWPTPTPTAFCPIANGARSPSSSSPGSVRQRGWEATRHDRHHVHLTISKDRFDGTRMSTSHDLPGRGDLAIWKRGARADFAIAAAWVPKVAPVGFERTLKPLPEADPNRIDWLRATISRVIREGGGIEELRSGCRCDSIRPAPGVSRESPTPVPTTSTTP